MRSKGENPMKKVVALAVLCAMSLSLFGCASKDAGSGKSGGDDDKPKATAAAQDDQDNSKDSAVGFSAKGEYIVFNVDASFDLKEDAWLGFCPGTKGYKDEVDADDYDVAYAYYNADKSTSSKYVFEFEVNYVGGLEDGDYTVVLCDSDSEGKVILYFPAVKSGNDVKCDFDKITINK